MSHVCFVPHIVVDAAAAFKRSTDAGERNYNATTVVTTHGGPPAIVAPALPALDSRLVLPLCPVFLQHASQIYSKAQTIEIRQEDRCYSLALLHLIPAWLV